MKFIAALFVIGLFIPALGFAQAAPASYPAICRGANIPAHQILMKKAVMQKLEEEGISYRSVRVIFSKLKRPKTTLQPDFASGLTIGEGATPIVSYSGSFAEPVGCEITGKMKIFVSYENGRTFTVNDVVVPGTLLWRNRKTSVEELD